MSKAEIVRFQGAAVNAFCIVRSRTFGDRAGVLQFAY